MSNSPTNGENQVPPPWNTDFLRIILQLRRVMTDGDEAKVKMRELQEEVVGIVEKKLERILAFELKRVQWEKENLELRDQVLHLYKVLNPLNKRMHILHPCCSCTISGNASLRPAGTMYSMTSHLAFFIS